MSIETILSESTGWFPNVWMCLEEYERARTSEDRQRWEGEFLYWNSKVFSHSDSISKKYRERFDKLKENTQYNLFR